MLKIRLQRVGRKHEPVFRLVATESQNSTKSGKFLEILGNYDPRDKNEASFKKERILEWISKGAKPTDTVHNLLISNKIIEGEKINVLPKKTPIKKEVEAEAESAPVADTEAKLESDTPAETVTEAPADTPAEEPKAEESKEEVEASTPTEETSEAPTDEVKEEKTE